MPDCTTVLIWLIGTAVLTGLTVNDFVPLVRDYAHNNVATQIAVITNDKVIRPNVSICLFYYSNALENIAEWIANGRRNQTECEECMAMAEHGWDLWNEKRFLAAVESHHSVHDIKNGLANAITREALTKGLESDVFVLNRSNFNWNQPIVDAIWTLASCITYLDKAALGENRSFYSVYCNGFNLTDLEPLFYGKIDDLYDIVIESLETYLRCWPGYYKNTLSFGRTGDAPIRVADRAEFKAEMTICFTLLQNSSAELFGYEAFPDDHKPPWMPRRRQQSIFIKHSVGVIYGLGNVFDNLYETPENAVETINREEIKAAYEVANRVIEKRPSQPCSEENEPRLCLTRKLFSDVIDHCHCIPFSYKRLLSGGHAGLPYCNSSVYDQCTERTLANTEKYRAQCSNKCQHIQYRWTTTYKTDHDNSMNFSGFIAVQEIENPFLEFVVVTKDSPEKFLAQMGGLINFYLGFSGLSVCAAVVFCIDLFKRWKASESASHDVGMATIDRKDRNFGFQGHELGDKMDQVLREMQSLRTDVAEMKTGVETMSGRISRLEKRLR